MTTTSSKIGILDNIYSAIPIITGQPAGPVDHVGKREFQQASRWYPSVRATHGLSNTITSDHALSRSNPSGADQLYISNLTTLRNMHCDLLVFNPLFSKVDARVPLNAGEQLELNEYSSSVAFQLAERLTPIDQCKASFAQRLETRCKWENRLYHSALMSGAPSVVEQERLRQLHQCAVRNDPVSNYELSPAFAAQ